MRLVQLKTAVICAAILFELTGCRDQGSKPVPNASAIKRLDGSLVTSAEIDGTVIRLMKAAKITARASRALLVSARYGPWKHPRRQQQPKFLSAASRCVPERHAR